jgi:hypothetical protein
MNQTKKETAHQLPIPRLSYNAYYDLPWKDREKIRISDTYNETY